jgi:DNA-binding winged helix-turn-helix (wHTH) protein
MILDVDRAFLVTDDMEGIQLTHQEADVLAALAINRGLAAFDVLIADVWGEHRPADPQNQLAVVIKRLRGKLERLPGGAKIHSIRMFGYFMPHRIEVRRVQAPVRLPAEMRSDLLALLASHPDRVKAARVMEAVG